MINTDDRYAQGDQALIETSRGTSRVRRPLWLATALALVTIISCDEQPRSAYESFGEAEKAGAVARGWIPSYVPASASSIVEVHDIDVNVQRI